MKRTEAEAREAVAGAHSLTCARSDGRTSLCSCGGPMRPIAHLDAYAEAVRAAERARLAAKLATWGASVRKVDVLRVLTEDTAR